jgi:pyrroline-5-carboxylate reductase
MRQIEIGFVGGGRIAGILLGGWARAGRMPAKVVVSDADAGVLTRLATAFPNVRSAGNDNCQAAGQDIVFLAVHPPHVGAVLGEVQSALKPGAILISLAPKWTIEKLAGLLSGFTRIARMIPNAPSIVGQGFNPIAFSSVLTRDDRDVVTQLLTPLGDCVETAEEKLEAYAVLSAMGPTYFWPQCYELIALGESFGLTGAEAALALQRMLAGTMATIRESGLDAAAVQDLIPVKHLAELEPIIREAYRTKLKAVYEKIRP